MPVWHKNESHFPGCIYVKWGKLYLIIKRDVLFWNFKASIFYSKRVFHNDLALPHGHKCMAAGKIKVYYIKSQHKHKIENKNTKWKIRKATKIDKWEVWQGPRHAFFFISKSLVREPTQILPNILPFQWKRSKHYRILMAMKTPFTSEIFRKQLMHKLKSKKKKKGENQM